MLFNVRHDFTLKEVKYFNVLFIFENNWFITCDKIVILDQLINNNSIP